MKYDSEKQQGNLLTRMRSLKFWRPWIGLFLGGILGYVYYYFIGCSANSCPITSNPYLTIIGGGLIGFLIAK